MKLSILLFEGIETKINLLIQRLTGPNSRWSGKAKYSNDEIKQFIEALIQWDPTGNKAKYLPYMIRQLSLNNLVAEPGRLDDLERFKNALSFFESNYRSQNWQYARDINQFANWRNLEDIALNSSDDYTSKRQARRNIAGADVVGTVVVPNDYKTTFQLIKFTEPEALALYGMGTKWCTSTLSTKAYHQDYVGQLSMKDYDKENAPTMKYPSWHQLSGSERPMQWMEIGNHSGYPTTAVSYLAHSPIYIIFQKDSGPKSPNLGRSGQVGQFTDTAARNLEFKDVRDNEITVISPALSYALKQWADESEAIPMLLKRGRLNDDLNDLQNKTGFPKKPDTEESQGFDDIEIDGRDTRLFRDYSLTWVVPELPKDAWYYDQLRIGHMPKHITLSSYEYGDYLVVNYNWLLKHINLRLFIILAHTIGFPVDSDEIYNFVKLSYENSHGIQNSPIGLPISRYPNDFGRHTYDIMRYSTISRHHEYLNSTVNTLNMIESIMMAMNSGG